MKFLRYNLWSSFFGGAFLLSFFLPSTSLAQTDINLNRLVHIGMEQGLSSDKVNCIFQDRKEFTWLGTDYGLDRYDGYNFKVFTKKENPSLTDNDIKCLTQKMHFCLIRVGTLPNFFPFFWLAASSNSQQSLAN